MIDGKQCGLSVHRAVLKTFDPDGETEERNQINHKDGNKTNNCLENLEWNSAAENMRHSIDVLGNYCGARNYRAKKITGLSVDNPEEELKFPSIIDAAKFLFPNDEYKVLRRRQNNIWRALKGQRKTAYRYKWSYDN